MALAGATRDVLPSYRPDAGTRTSQANHHQTGPSRTSQVRCTRLTSPSRREHAAVKWILLTPLVTAWLRPVLLVLLSFLYGYWIYQMIIGIRGFQPPRPLPRATTYRRFAILIPAHNEAKVIGQLLDSLERQQYPKQYFDVYVSCDNCSDNTADIAKAKHALPLIRNDPLHPGKTWNVRWALTQIPLAKYDAVALFDADNVAASQFLSSMNYYLEAHPDIEAVQGYLDTKNPHDSWVTRVYALNYWYINRFWQLARVNWGLSAALGGTGLVIRTSCIRRIGWELQSLTEDLEFSTRLVLEGGRVGWNEWAVTYDEKPITHSASRRQRTRWLQGHYWVLWHYGPKLALRFLQTGNVVYLDYFLHLLAPGKAALNYIFMFAGLMAPLASWALDHGRPLEWYWYVWPILAVIQSAYQVVIGPSLRHGRLVLRYVPSALWYFWYGLTWIPMVFYAAWLARDQNHWVKTEHTRAISVDSLSRH